MNHKHFAAGVRARRKLLKLKQVDVAEYAAISRSALCNIEKGWNGPGFNTARLLAQKLGMTIEELEALGRDVLSNE